MTSLRKQFAFLALATSLAGCQLAPPQVSEPQPPAPPPIEPPLATYEFEFDPQRDRVIGTLQVTYARHEDTLSDIARRFNLGYEEIVRANPGVDPWLPGEGTEIVLPTQFVLPNAPYEGLVINLAQLRMFYFPPATKGEPRKVITHPVGIGKVGWATPEGTTKVTAKTKNPTWYPPASVRKEHAAAGDPLPAKVPPGPDNPLGTHALRLGWPSYLIHGTNKPYGVGLRSSHGCVRFYPEDIARLYDMVPIGTKVTVVNQPFVFGWQDDVLYMQAFPVLEDDKRKHPQDAQALVEIVLSDDVRQLLAEHDAEINFELVDDIIANPRGIVVPVSMRGVTVEDVILSARYVENTLPEGATWDGSDRIFYTAEEYEAARASRASQQSTVADPEGARAVAAAGTATKGTTH